MLLVSRPTQPENRPQAVLAANAARSLKGEPDKDGGPLNGGLSCTRLPPESRSLDPRRVCARKPRRRLRQLALSTTAGLCSCAPAARARTCHAWVEINDRIPSYSVSHASDIFHYRIESQEKDGLAWMEEMQDSICQALCVPNMLERG